MKIKLLTNLGDEKSNYLNVTVLIKTPRMHVRSVIIVDTGSPHTILSYSDSRRLQIPFNENEGELISIGGRKYHGYTAKRVTITFLTEDEKAHTESLEGVKIIRPTSIKEMEEVDRIPTIIGTDFLKRTGFVLVCDMANEEAYLERK